MAMSTAKTEPPKSQRVRFECIFCHKKSTRHVRAGHYVRCAHCGEANPGPRMLDGLRRAALTSPVRSASPEQRPKAAARSSTHRAKASSPAADSATGRTRKRAVIKIAPQTTPQPKPEEPPDTLKEDPSAPPPTDDDAGGSFKPSGLFDAVMYG